MPIASDTDNVFLIHHSRLLLLDLTTFARQGMLKDLYMQDGSSTKFETGELNESETIRWLSQTVGFLKSVSD